MATIDFFDIILGKRKYKEKHQKTKPIGYYENQVRRCKLEYENSVTKLKELNTSVANTNANINECHQIIEFVNIIKKDVVSNKSLLKALDRLESYILGGFIRNYPNLIC